MISQRELLLLLKNIYYWIWGAPFFLLFFGSSLYLTYALRGLQIRYLPHAFKLMCRENRGAKGDITPYQSLMTALAANLGVANIAGVATAITAGGSGALFWMWISTLLGMILRYAEALLAVKYRTAIGGKMAGGPMYFIERGLGWKKLAIAFSIFGSLAALGGGNMLQANSIADVMDGMFNISPWTTGAVLATLTALTIAGGVRSIGLFAASVVPIMALSYLLCAIAILFYHLEQIPSALSSIFTHAFSSGAVGGGFLGVTAQNAIRVGLTRGIMASEAALGTASIAASAAKTRYPVEQGLVSMTGGFLTTIVMCSVTALVLQVTHATEMVDALGLPLDGACMAVGAFQTLFSSWGGYFVSLSLLFFGFTTIVGYAYYAERCLEYLFGEVAIPFYRIIFIACVVVGSVLHLEFVWMLSDIANGLTAYTNLIGVVFLSTVVIKETKKHLKKVISQENI